LVPHTKGGTQTEGVENRVLRRIFGPKREEVAGDWRRLRNLYSSPYIIRLIKSKRMRGSGHVALMGVMKNAYKILVRKPEERRLLERPRHRWEVNIRIDLREICWEDVDWIHLAQDRDQWWDVVNTIIDLRVP
jgi:hypothetical protein